MPRKLKYDPIFALLQKETQNIVYYSLDELDSFVHGGLPDSARNQYAPQFWSNPLAYSRTRRQWLNAGYRAFFEAPSHVKFEKIGPGAEQLVLLAAEIMLSEFVQNPHAKIMINSNISAEQTDENYSIKIGKIANSDITINIWCGKNIDGKNLSYWVGFGGSEAALSAFYAKLSPPLDNIVEKSDDDFIENKRSKFYYYGENRPNFGEIVFEKTKIPGIGIYLPPLSQFPEFDIDRATTFVRDILDRFNLTIDADDAFNTEYDIKRNNDLREFIRTTGSGQGFGLNAKQRKAVELRAMEVARDALEAREYVIENKSQTHPFDFMAKKDGKLIKVEVKGTTSKTGTKIWMTRNEVMLHQNERGNTALILVEGIELSGDENICKATNGNVKVFIPWYLEISDATPITYEVILNRD